MGEGDDPYSKQVYFDLSTNTFQMRELKDWDLCFESGDKAYGVFCNLPNSFMKICKSEIFQLIEPKNSDTNYIKHRVEFNELIGESDGQAAHSAIGDWSKFFLLDNNKQKLPGVYFIELKYLNDSNRFWRLQIISVNDTAYICTISQRHDNKPAEIVIKKNKVQNFTFYSLRNGGRIVDNAEPPKNNWDIEFTKYFSYVSNSTTTIPYNPIGVLSNPNNVEVATDFNTAFDSINGNSLINYTFNKNRDAIGYDNWKTIDNYGSNFKYTVHSNITYIIKDTDGHYYKLRFLDFYDKLLRRGNPKFEFIRIK